MSMWVCVWWVWAVKHKNNAFVYLYIHDLNICVFYVIIYMKDLTFQADI